MALPANETFTGSNGTTIGSLTDWTNIRGQFQIQDNQCQPTGGGENAAYWNADTPDDDQYAEMEKTQVSYSGFPYVGPAVRCSDSAISYYGLYRGGDDSYFFKVVSGSFTSLGTPSDHAAVGEVMRIEAEGTTITAYVEGVSVGTTTDASLSSGYLGICGYGNGVGRGDNWAGGNLSAGGPTEYTQDVSGSASSAGTAVLETRKTFTGTGAGAGALARLVDRVVSGAGAGGGTISREAAKVVAGAGAGTGAISRGIDRVLTGAGASVGTLTRQISRAVSGAGAGAGALASIRVFVRSFEGAGSSAGTISRETRKVIAGAGSGLGSINRLVARLLSGAGSGAGVFEAIKTTGLILVELTGASTAAGAISRETRRAVEGAASGVGALNRAVGRVVAGSGAGSGTLASIRVFTMVLSGASAGAGAIGRQINKTLAGASAGGGVVGRAISRVLSGASSAVGALATVFGLQNQPGRAGVRDQLRYGASVDVRAVGNAESTVSDGDIS